MEKLFDENVGIVNIRPTEITKQQREELFLKLADEIIKNQYCKNGDRETIAYDLGQLKPYDSGFEKAKQLEDDSFLTYIFQGDFIDFLDGMDSEIRCVLNENVKLWVRAYDVKPKLEIAQKLLVQSNLNREKKVDDIVYVRGIQEQTANYLIDCDPNRSGGTVIAFEIVESNCKKI